LGLAPFWRGVLAGLLPLLGYALWATGNWMGLDVLAIHTAVYLSTATLLTLAAGRRQEGRPASARLHWAPKAFIAFFLFVLVVNGVFLYVASQGLPPGLARWLLPGAEEGRVHTAFPGVVPHGLDAAKEVGSALSARHRQLRLGWRVDASGLDLLAREGAAVVVVSARDRDESPLADAEVRLTLTRPGAAREELAVPLAAGSPGNYQAWVRAPEGGRWLVRIEVRRGGDVFHAEEQLTIDRAP
jgi:nitrogen fixation protein FixH